jgi:DNA-binding response OmpR family regulator
VDDYIGKPFSPRELIARMKALLSARARPRPRVRHLFSGPSRGRNRAHGQIDGETIALSPKEFDLLAFFVSRPEVAFTRINCSNMFGDMTFSETRGRWTQHVKSLREKLGAYREHIVTVWGTGYRFSGGGT